MNFTQFVSWIKAADIDQKYKERILNADLSKPEEYVRHIRECLREMSAARVKLKYGKLSLAQVSKILDPGELSGQEFYQTIPGVSILQEEVSRLQSSLSVVKNLLSNPVEINRTIKVRAAVKFEVDSEYATRDGSFDYLDYLMDESATGFKAGNNFDSNVNRIYGVICQAFTEGEREQFGYTEKAFEARNMKVLRECILLEAAMFDVETKYCEDDAVALRNITSMMEGAEIITGEQLVLLRTKLTLVSSPIIRGQSLNGKLSELVPMVRQVIAYVSQPDFKIFKEAYHSNFKEAYHAYKAELAKLQAVETTSADQEATKRQHLDDFKQLEASINVMTDDPADVGRLYEKMAHECAARCESISRMAEKELISAAQKALGAALSALHELYRQSGHTHVGDKVKAKTLFNRIAQSIPAVKDKAYDSILRPLLDAYHAKLQVMKFSSEKEAGDASHEVMLELLLSLPDKYKKLILDKDFYEFISTREMSKRIHSRSNEHDNFGEVNPMFSEIVTFLPFARAELLFAIHKNGSRVEMSSEDIEALYHYRRGHIEDVVGEHIDEFLRAVDERYAQISKNKSDVTYAENLLGLVGVLDRHNADIGQPQPEMVVDEVNIGAEKPKDKEEYVEIVHDVSEDTEGVVDSDDPDKSVSRTKTIEELQEMLREDDLAQPLEPSLEQDNVAQPLAPSLEDAKQKALNIMLLLQRLPEAENITEVTVDTQDFYDAALELNQRIPGGFSNPVEFANNLINALPSNVELYSDNVLDKLLSIHDLYEQDTTAFRQFLNELWQAVDTKKKELDIKSAIHAALPIEKMRENITRILDALSGDNVQEVMAALYIFSHGIDRLKPWMQGKHNLADANKFLEQYYPGMALNITDPVLLKNGAVLQDALGTIVQHYADSNNPEMITETQMPQAAMTVFASLAEIDFTDPRIEYEDSEMKELAKSVNVYCKDSLDANNNISIIDDACTEYMKHLGREIYEGVRDHDFDLCKRYVFTENGKQKFDLGGLMSVISENGRDIQLIRARDQSFDMAIKKYQAVKEMRSKIRSDKAPVEKLADFEKSYKANRALIEERRDTGAVKFLKVLATIFTFGIVAAAGLWRVKGKKFSDKISSKLPSDPKQQGPRK